MKRSTIISLFLTVLVVVFVVSCSRPGGGGDGGNQDDSETCTFFSYSDWTPVICPANEIQTRTIISSTPVGCTGGNPILTQTCTFVPDATKMTLNDDTHVIKFDVSQGNIAGLFDSSGTYPADVEEIVVSSDRVGWMDESSATAAFNINVVDFMITVIVDKTANSDRAKWALKLFDGTYVWFDPDQWTFEGKPNFIDNGFIEYGSYQEESISFHYFMSAMIEFNSNVISLVNELGLIPADIDRIQWNSNTVGWGDLSTVYSTLETYGNGDYYVSLISMPCSDTGNFSVRKTDGTYVYFKATSLWNLSSNASINTTTWRFEYTDICN